MKKTIAIILIVLCLLSINNVFATEVNTLEKQNKEEISGKFFKKIIIQGLSTSNFSRYIRQVGSSNSINTRIVTRSYRYSRRKNHGSTA